jgi:predicted MFS family arabinose efflux permease
MNQRLSDRQLVGFMLAASVASTIGGLPFNSLPVMLGSLADSFKLEAQAVGLIGSICFAGYLVGTLGAPLWINRLNWRLLTLVSAVGTAASFAASAMVRDLLQLQVVWALIGFFASTMTCLGMRILSDLPNKVRAYGVRQGVELSVTALVLFALPPLVIATFKYPGAAWALAGVVAVLGLSAWWVPAHSLAAADSAPRGGPISAAAWVALAVFFVYLAGNIGLWAFLERVGASRHIAPAQMGLVFAVLKLLGGVAAFSMGALGERLPMARAHALALAVLAVGLLMLGAGSGFGAYALGAWVWEFAFTCGCILQTAHIARCDPGGRAIVLVPAAFALGSMVGPAVAGQLFGTGQVVALLALAGACSLVPWVAASVSRKAK